MKQKRLSNEKEEHLDNLLDSIYEMMHKKADFYNIPVNHKDPTIYCSTCGMSKQSIITCFCDHEFCPYNK